jgi:hypothetical protein
VVRGVCGGESVKVLENEVAGTKEIIVNARLKIRQGAEHRSPAFSA